MDEVYLEIKEKYEEAEHEEDFSKSIDKIEYAPDRELTIHISFEEIKEYFKAQSLEIGDRCNFPEFAEWLTKYIVW